eukprot:NODE_3737_length_911_cov_20.117347_g3585_i0.p1 GENE.NODE_3737_length_911_cov_20.117347_g3585_i0~~NODE_3737_length_911_cov_20.117347_g3585_i0.p1  ORF type:complete len:271 (+),score=74.02 NODE_3737_length_911_cov_20.117347_g3585_i0:49-813(+)
MMGVLVVAFPVIVLSSTFREQHEKEKIAAKKLKKTKALVKKFRTAAMLSPTALEPQDPAHTPQEHKADEVSSDGSNQSEILTTPRGRVAFIPPNAVMPLKQDWPPPDSAGDSKTKKKQLEESNPERARLIQQFRAFAETNSVQGSLDLQAVMAHLEFLEDGNESSLHSVESDLSLDSYHFPTSPSASSPPTKLKRSGSILKNSESKGSLPAYPFKRSGSILKIPEIKEPRPARNPKPSFQASASAAQDLELMDS